MMYVLAGIGGAIIWDLMKLGFYKFIPWFFHE